jgi:hypothetical protein
MKPETTHPAFKRSGSALEGNNLVDRVVEFPFGDKQIIVGLKIDPELRGRAEIARKPQGCVRGNVTLLPDNLLHAIARNEERLGKSARCQAIFGQKILPENFPGMNRSRPIIAHISHPSMIIDDLNLESVAVFPLETDAPLAVDANAVLSLAVALQRLEVIGRRNTQVFQRRSSIKLGKPTLRSRNNIGGKSFRCFARAHGIQPLVFRRLDHEANVSSKDTCVNLPYSEKIQILATQAQVAAAAR